MLIFRDFIQVYVFITNHHLKAQTSDTADIMCFNVSKIRNTLRQIFSTIQSTPSVIIGFMTLLCNYLCDMGYFL